MLCHGVLDELGNRILRVVFALVFLDRHQLHNSDILHTQLKMVELGQEFNHLMISKHVLLEVLELLGNLDIVHIEALILSVPVFLFLEFFHESVLFAEKHLFTSAINQLLVDLLWQGENVVERGLWQTSNLHVEALNMLVELRVLILNSLQVRKLQLFDNRFDSKTKRHL